MITSDPMMRSSSIRRRIDSRRIGVLLLCCTYALMSQDHPHADRPLEFEAATIKPVGNDTSGSVGIRIDPGARLFASGLSLKGLIAVAFHLSYWQISVTDPWMEKNEYVVEAVPSDEMRAKITNRRHTLFGIEDERLRKMLQALIIERFHLILRQDVRDGVSYRLERSNRQLLLRNTGDRAGTETAGAVFSSIGYADGRWVITSSSTAQIAKFAADFVLRAPVEDHTGLIGLFEYKQSGSDKDPNYRDNSASFLELMSELGLKLVRGRGPVETIVVEHATKL